MRDKSKLENKNFQSEYWDSKKVFWLDPSPKIANTATKARNDPKIIGWYKKEKC